MRCELVVIQLGLLWSAGTHGSHALAKGVRKDYVAYALSGRTFRTVLPSVARRGRGGRASPDRFRYLVIPLSYPSNLPQLPRQLIRNIPFVSRSAFTGSRI